jgi:hypothetical protein
MAGFENYAQDTRDIELEIERRGVALGIDWHNEEQVRALAREALTYPASEITMLADKPDYTKLAKLELFGLAGLMLRTMQESAETGFESHGGDAWKAFARALWAERRQLPPA